jgi:hypothetical protein
VEQPTVEITYARIEEAEDSCTRQKCPPAPWGARFRYAHVNFSCQLIEQYASGRPSDESPVRTVIPYYWFSTKRLTWH